MISSSVTSTDETRGSFCAAVLIPNLTDSIQMFDDHPSDTIEFLRAEAVIGTHLNWLYPKLADAAISLNMNMPRFAAIKAVEEKTIRAIDV